jgi:DNA repair exonuclease SbcCD ATPase subunit
MITVEPSEIKLTDQINALQTEIATRTLDIQNLQEALDTLIAGKPRPINPSADGAFEMLRELVGSVPENLEEQQLYQAKLGEAQRTLQLAISVCEQKENQLKELRQKQDELRAKQLFEQLKTKAERFNSCITEVVSLLDEIKQDSSEIYKLSGDNPLSGIYIERRELPWVVISDKNVLIKRKFDVR